MRDDPGDEDLTRLVADLVAALRELESELERPEPGRPPRLPTPREMRRFASDVAIPGLILVLETNVRALRLLQRSLRLADEAERAGESASEIRARAETASATTLERLDGALAELQSAIEGRPDNDEAAALLAEARELRAEVERRLEERARENGAGAGSPEDDTSTDEAEDREDEGAVQVDVDAELESIKAELDDVRDEPEDSDEDGPDGDDDPDPDSRGDDGDDEGA